MTESKDNILDDLTSILEVLNWSNQFKDKDIMFMRCFTENWFSDSLSWLLDPKGSHGLGVKFSKDFLKTIALKRSNEDRYKNKKTFLKQGKVGNGVTISSLKIANASSIREFYLSRSTGDKKNRTQNFCDVVLLDLDVNDGIIVTIENKLFTTNHNDQLELYYDLVEEKYSRTKVREYVYLTIDGTKPEKISDEKYLKSWVCVSWLDDIFEILPPKEKGEHSDITMLRSCLTWLRNLQRKSLSEEAENLKNLLRGITILNLLEELDRLNEGKKGYWYFEKNRLGHSSYPSKFLSIEILSNLTISIQGKKATNALFDKIIIPFGIHPDQVFNLIEIAAREICYGFFGDSVKTYLANKKRISDSKLRLEKEEMELMNIVHNNFLELKTIVSSVKFL